MEIGSEAELGQGNTVFVLRLASFMQCAKIFELHAIFVANLV